MHPIQVWNHHENMLKYNLIQDKKTPKYFYKNINLKIELNLILHEKDKHHFYLLLLIYVFVQKFLIPIKKRFQLML